MYKFGIRKEWNMNVELVEKTNVPTFILVIDVDRKQYINSRRMNQSFYMLYAREKL